MERGGDHGRQPRDAPQMLVPPSSEEKVRTVFVHSIPESLSTGDGIEKLLGAVGKLRRWDACTSVMEEHKGAKFGFALYDDPESLSTAIKLLHEQAVEVPLKRQPVATNPPPEDDDTFEGFEKAKLQVSVDESSLMYIESYEEEKGDDAGSEQRLSAAKAALKQVIRELFYPPVGSGADANGDVSMKNNENGENVEVVNITLAQDDELSDIPAEMREVVAGEIAAFRERSNQRDLERLRKEEEMEEMERRRNGAPRSSRLATPPGGAGANNIPLGPRGAPSGPKGQNGVNRVPFVYGGVSNAEYSINREDEDTDADDEELYRRQQAKQKAEADKSYAEMERKWANRERSRQAALEREQERERQESETFERRKQEQLERDKAWDDDREASRKSHLYYRDPVSWARKRTWTAWMRRRGMRLTVARSRRSRGESGRSWNVRAAWPTHSWIARQRRWNDSSNSQNLSQPPSRSNCPSVRQPRKPKHLAADRDGPLPKWRVFWTTRRPTRLRRGSSFLSNSSPLLPLRA
jgi:hypothetical protein